MRRRPAARILLTDPGGRALLFRFDHHHGALAGTGYWATPGGGVERNESVEEAAIRELKEETGIIVADPGPIIARREIVMQVSTGDRVLEEECYFHIAVPNDRISLDGWTPSERSCLTSYRWWTTYELEWTQDRISPEHLLVLLRKQQA